MWPSGHADAERFVASFKQEYLNRVIPCVERHLRWPIAEYVEHYHRERNHLGLDRAVFDGSTPGPTV
jgi:hypothetical protein